MVAYVVMPEHVHLVISEPSNGPLASAVQAIKQSVSRKLIGNREHFWQERYYDFNVWSSAKRIEKVKYIHRNPVRRELVERPEDWVWSSFRNYLIGESGRSRLNHPGRSIAERNCVPRPTLHFVNRRTEHPAFCYFADAN